MNLPIPGEVKIGGTVYSVLGVDSNPLVDNHICGGCISYRGSQIEILTQGVSDDMRQVALWHEVIHGIADDRCMEAYLNTHDEPGDEQVEAFARGWTSFIRDNAIGEGDKTLLRPSLVIGPVTYTVDFVDNHLIISNEERACAAWLDRDGGIIHLATKGHSTACQEMMVLHMIVKCIAVDRRVTVLGENGDLIRNLAGGLHAFMVDNGFLVTVRA